MKTCETYETCETCGTAKHVSVDCTLYIYITYTFPVHGG